MLNGKTVPLYYTKSHIAIGVWHLHNTKCFLDVSLTMQGHSRENLTRILTF